jgi:hypothetical protein
MTDKIATDLEERNGVFFEPNETVPFTGTKNNRFSKRQDGLTIFYLLNSQRGW